MIPKLVRPSPTARKTAARLPRARRKDAHGPRFGEAQDPERRLARGMLSRIETQLRSATPSFRNGRDSLTSFGESAAGHHLEKPMAQLKASHSNQDTPRSFRS